MKVFFGRYIHKCPQCPFRTVTRTSLTNHMRTHTGERSFVCGVCGRALMGGSALRQRARMSARGIGYLMTTEGRRGFTV